MWSFIKGVDLPEGKKKRLETMTGRNAVQNKIGTSHRESRREVFRGCFGTTATICRPIADRAVEAHHHQHPTLIVPLSSSVIQYSDGKLSVLNECVS